MTESLELPSLERALAYELPELSLRFSHETGLSLDDSQLLFREAKRWLWACACRDLAATAGRDVPPPLVISPELRPIDLMWHAFLLYTREYREFCDTRLGGHFVHHIPLREAERAAFEQARTQDPRAALTRRRAELKPQLDYLYDLIGADVLKLWYQGLPRVG